MLEWQVTAKMHDLRLVHLSEWRLDAYRSADRPIDDFLEGGKEVRSRVGKRIRPEHAECHGRHAMSMAPQHRLGQQQHIPARKKNCFVGSVCPRYIAAGDAPVIGIQVGHWLVENRQLLKCRPFKGFEITANIFQLNRFPVQATSNIEGTDLGRSSQRLAQQDGTIEPAAHQDGHGIRVGELHEIMVGWVKALRNPP